MTMIRRRLLGLFALMLIVGIIVGLPAALLAVGANPVPSGLPTLDEITATLTSPDDGTLALGLVTVAAWVAWAFATLSILLEILARLRGVRAPRLPGLRLPQHAARSLVSTAMLVFITLPGTTPADAAPAAAPPAPSISASLTTPTAASTSTQHPTPAASTPVAAPGQHTTTRTVTHTVQEGETLWSIAATMLGDGHRYTEILEASRGIPQPGGATLTDPDVIDVGWTLKIPDVPTTPAAGQQSTRAVTHTVQEGETLWSIAATMLGDGHRYTDILALNRDILGDQADLIQPGWTLQLPPAPAPAPADTATVVVQPGDTLAVIALQHYGDATRYPEIVEASRDIPQPGGARLTDPDVIDVGWTLRVPGVTATPAAQPAAPPANPPPSPTPTTQAPTTTPTPPPPTPAPPAPSAGTTAEPQAAPADSTAPSATDPADLLEEPGWTARTSAGVGALLAAGVLALLAVRRHAQQRRRHPGQRMPLPTGTAAAVEQDLRATADPLSITTVDVALRTLARTCTDTGMALPAARAARLTATQFDLYLVQPADLPAPWTGTADDTVWTLNVDTTAALTGIDVSDIPAPYPALVTIGHDEDDGHVLLNLETLGTLGVSGPDATATREVLTALAIELATSTWADDLQVTLVGALPDLEDTLQTGRIRYLPSVGRLLEDLLTRADTDRQALAAAGAPDLQHARVTGAAPDAWAPQILLLAGEITDRQRTQLTQLVTDLPRVAMAAVTTGLSVGQWGLDLAAGDDPDDAVLTPIGLHLRPQRLPAEHYAHLLEVASLADIEELDPTEINPPPSVAEVEDVPLVDEAPSAVSAMPEINLDHLEAIAAATPSSLAGTPSDPPLVPSDQQPTDDSDTPQEAESQEPADPSGQPPAPPAVAVGPTTDPAGTVPAPPSSTDQGSQSVTGQDPAAPDTPTPAPPVRSMPLPAPRILVLGPVDLRHAAGPVEPTKRARLLELAAYLALHPGATRTAIDDAIWPDRRHDDNINTRNTATSKLRRWVGTDPVSGADYLPGVQSGEGYGFHPAVTADAHDWEQLLAHDPLNAPTERLEQALALVRGIPFEGTHRRRYAWAEPIRHRLSSEIVDACYELARRRLMEGRWRGAEEAVVVGLRIEPAQESLWRLRILAAHESRNPAAKAEAIDRLMLITEQLECDLEPETEQLLAAVQTPGADFDTLMAKAL